MSVAPSARFPLGKTIRNWFRPRLRSPIDRLADVRYADDGRFARFVRSLRHPLRVVAMVGAALALSWGVATAGSLAAIVVGTAAGVIVGEMVGRSAWRLLAVWLGAALFVAAGLALSSLATGAAWVSGAIGPSAALTLSGVVRYGLVSFGALLALRATAIRHVAGLAVEVAAVLGALSILFSAHREGVIARPLWLSDWAWQQGVDPGEAFLFLGATSAALLAILLVLENRGGRALSSLVALPLLALLSVAFLDVVGRPTPQAEDGLGLTTDEEGEPPQELPTTPNDPPGNQGDDGRDGGSRPETLGDAGVSTGVADGGGNSGAPLDGGGGGSQSTDGGGSSASQNLDGGNDGGGASGAADASNDGGGASGGVDSSVDGGGSSGGVDAGADGGGSGSSADAGPPPPSGGGQGGETGDTPPPPSSVQLEDQSDGPTSSPAPMAVVILENDYSPPAQAYYFRQEAWSQFNGTRLVPATVPDTDEDVLEAFPTAVVDVDGPPADGREAVRARVALLVDHQHPFALESPIRFEPIANPNTSRFVRAYRFEALAQAGDYGTLLGKKSGDPSWTEEARAMYLEPHPDPRFGELVEEIMNGGELPPAMRSDPFARALAIKLWLDHNLIYSTKERHRNAPDPTLDFLFGNRTGYCVHFGHSAVFLWRAAGLPSRIGTGYMVPEENRRGGSSILVRSGDAHAWPELYLDEVGWVVLDISAEQNLDEAGQPLDEELQRMLGEMAREQPQDPADEVQNEPKEDSWLWTWLVAHVWYLLAGLVLLVAGVLYGIKGWRRIAPAFASRHRLPAIGYRATLDRLGEVGLVRQYGETRESFAARVADDLPSFRELTALHVAARLGPHGAQHFDRTQYRTLAAGVRREVRQARRWWRRLLGLLHPVSFLDSK